MTLSSLASCLMKFIHLGIKEVLCDKDTDSGIKSRNAHYQKDGPEEQRKSWVWGSKLEK